MRFFNANEIKPQGWLKKQLEIQAAGLSGNLDKIWPDVQNSKWIGGDREGWERVPYWLDGFIPLAYLLDDADMKERVKKYINAIMEGQKEDGWICPCTDEERTTYDVWALFLMTKVLVVYADCSGDDRVEDCIYRALKNLHYFLKTCTIKQWAASRWYECLISICWIYERRPEEWLKELAKRLRSQGADYENVSQLWDTVVKEWSFETHVVNAAMALKGEALYSAFLGKESTGEAEKLYNLLMKYHSTVYGHFTGDECLAGDSPIQGTELCGIAEAMYSYELLFSITKNPVWAERLEKLAFNALPATISEDMWTHQYDQLTNQIAAVSFPDAPIFGTNGPESNCFGLEPNFGCCTANFNQAWPKFARSAIGKDKDGIIILSCVPLKIESEWKGAKVNVEVETEYPFRNRVKIKVHSESEGEWTLRVRIPNSDDLYVCGMEKHDGFLVTKIEKGQKEFLLTLERKPKLVERPMGLYALQYGSLIFALPIKERKVVKEYVKDGVERKFPYCDYEIYPDSAWEFAFAGEGEFEVEECAYSNAFSRENPPLKIYLNLAPIDWGEEKDHRFLAARLPRGGRTNGNVKMFFQPYGSTTLRMTELPICKK